MPRKRARGRGTVGVRTDGKFQARLPNRFGRRSIGVFDHEDAAHRELDVVLAELLNAEGSAELSFAAYGLGVLKQRETTHKDARREQSRWRNHVAGSDLGAMALEGIRQVHVRRFYNTLGEKISSRTGRPLGISLIRSVKSIVRQVFRAAVDAEIIDSSPAEGVYLPKYDLTDRAGDHDDSWTFLEADEVQIVDDYLIREGRTEALAAFRVGVYAGLRPGEILGLRWQDLLTSRKRAPRLYVRRSYNGPTKNKATRHVPLLPPALSALQQWRREAPKNQRDLIFPSETLSVRGEGFVWGWRDKPENLVNRSGEETRIVRQGIATRAGVDRHVTWYSATRHTCASHLLMGTFIRDAKGWMTRRLALEDVRKWLGHADISVTQRYAHLAEDWLDQHVRA